MLLDPPGAGFTNKKSGACSSVGGPPLFFWAKENAASELTRYGGVESKCRAFNWKKMEDIVACLADDKPAADLPSQPPQHGGVETVLSAFELAMSNHG